MAWVKIDDNALDHPKILALSDGAFRLWMRGLAHSRRLLTDGFISHLAVKGFREARASRIAELTTAPALGVEPLWELCEEGYRIHDYLQWNDTREHIETARAEARERMARLRGSSREVRTNNTRSSQSVRDTSTSPAPAQHQPGGSKEQEPPRGGKRRVFSGSAFFITENMQAVILEPLGKDGENFDCLPTYEAADTEWVRVGKPADVLGELKLRVRRAFEASKTDMFGPVKRDPKLLEMDRWKAEAEANPVVIRRA